MRKGIRVPLSVALLAVFAWAPAAAQSTLDLAKKEGKVVWYSSASLRVAQKICNLFNDKKLGVECVLHRDGSDKLFSRWRQEARAGLHIADVLHTSDVGHFVSLKKEAELLKYRPKEAERIDPNFMDKEGFWGVARASVYIPIYNTTRVKENEAPQSWLDFLDPKWKDGKLVHAHPAYSGFVSIGLAALVKQFGWEFLDKLAAQKPRIVQSAIDTTTFVVRGEALMSVGGTGYESFVAIRKGEPVKFLSLKEGLPFIVSPQAILAKAPHPNAAKIFTDFTYTKEVQQIFANEGLYVGHPDVSYPKGLTPLKELKLMVVPPEEAVKMNKPVEDNFRRKFGV